MSIFTLLSLAALGASTAYLAWLLRGDARGPGREVAERFREAEERVRSLKSSQKLKDPSDALEQVARALWGEEVVPQLAAFRETREKLAQARLTARESEGFEGSLVIPRVFRDPDPDVGLARLFYERGARRERPRREFLLAAGVSALAWILFTATLIGTGS